jgi:hypothetical protein
MVPDLKTRVSILSKMQVSSKVEHQYVQGALKDGKEPSGEMEITMQQFEGVTEDRNRLFQELYFSSRQRAIEYAEIKEKNFALETEHQSILAALPTPERGTNMHPDMHMPNNTTKLEP